MPESETLKKIIEKVNFSIKTLDGRISHNVLVIQEFIAVKNYLIQLNDEQQSRL